MLRALGIFMTLLILLGGSGFHRQASAQAKPQSGVPADDADVSFREPPTVQLTAKLHPVIIGDVGFEGLQSLDESDVLKSFRERRVGVMFKAPFVEANLDKGVKVINELLERNGHPKATVRVRTEEVSPRVKNVTFVINEGQNFYIKEIRFEGNRIFTDEELRAHLAYINTSGEVAFDRELVEYDLNNVRNYMCMKGYLTAKTREFEAQFNNDGVSISARVEEGALYRIGQISVEGAKLLSPEQVIQIIGLKPGDIADGKAISDGLYKKLKKYYADNGYLQYEADAEPEFILPEKAQEGIFNLKIQIEEFQCYKISAIEFVGSKRIPVEVLRRTLLIREGEVFNQQMFEDSLENLNGLGVFEAINNERGVKLNLDEGHGLAEIVINLVEEQDEPAR